ncbi:MAG TPA: TIGR01777 family oxidoreductase [Lacunisphaera sp.]
MAKVILAGGSGFLGRALGRALSAGGWEVVVLTRDPDRVAPSDETPALRGVMWNGETGGAWAAELEGAAALVNLAGRSINCVHSLENSREILDSRLNAVKALAKGYARAKNPPPVWVQCSATGFYGNAGDRFCEESLPPGPGFLAEVCRRWEEAFAALDLPDVRRVVLRLGPVLDQRTGPFPAMLGLTRKFLGGAAGSGRQFLSWIHRDDAVAAFAAAVDRPELNGVYNLCAPGAVTNTEFMRELRAAVGRPWVPPAPEFVVRFIAEHHFRTDGNLALHGQRCTPQKLLATGFKFTHPAVGGAIRDLLAPTR